MRRNYLILLSCLLFVFSAPTLAAEYVQSPNGQTDSGTYQEDYVFFGHDLEFTGMVEDFYFLGMDLLFKGETRRALMGFGENIEISGPVNNGVVAAGRSVLVGSPIKGTVFMAGENLMVKKNGPIDGSVFAASRRLDIQSEINGQVRAAAAEINLENRINGDVFIRAGKLTIGKKGWINGNLDYSTDFELTPEEASRVSGHINYKAPEEHHRLMSEEREAFKKPWWLGVIIFISFLIAGLLALVFPVSRPLNKRISRQLFVRIGLWGLIPVFVYPTLILLFSVLIVTIPLAILLFLAGVPLFIVFYILGTTMVGRQLATVVNLRFNSRYLYFLIGAVLLFALSFIPFLNIVLLIGVSGLGWGLALSAVFKRQLG